MIPPGPDATLLTQLNASGAPDARPQTPAEAVKAAEEFEAFFISQMVEAMFAGVETSEPFGGGAGEKAWQGLLHEEYGKIIAGSGGLGLADSLRAEMLRMQVQESA